MKMKQKLMILMCISALFLSACDNSSMTSKTTDGEDAVATEATNTSVEEIEISTVTNDAFTSEDLYNDWTKANVTEIEITDSEIISETGADEGVSIDGTTLTIKKGGSYAISGSCENGQIIIDSEDSDSVRLIFDTLNLTNSKGSALYIKQSAKTIVTLAKDSANVLADAAEYSEMADGVCATVFSNSDLTFNGKGEILITGNCQDGISCNSDLKIAEGTMTINATDDGIVGGKGISIKNGSYNIQCGSVGLKTTSVEDAEGFIGIQSGNYNITAGCDALNATGDVHLINGSFIVNTGGGSVVSSTNSGWGNFGDGSNTAKGIKAGGDVTIYSGAFNLDTADDAIYSGGSVKIDTGCVNISSGDDGIVSAEDININGGSISITQSYEGLESNTVNFTGGFIDINSFEDGINVAGGNDSSSAVKRAGVNGFDRTGDGQVSIAQTCMNVKADGDGMDVVGAIKITSGSVSIRGGADSSSSSVDCSGDYTIESGVIVATGNEDVMVTASADSAQNIICLAYPEKQAAGNIIVIKDSDGNTIVSFTPAAEYTKVFISKSAFEKNKTYTWYEAGLTDASALQFGDVSEDAYTVGDKIAEFKVSNGITKVDSSGVVK